MQLYLQVRTGGCPVPELHVLVAPRPRPRRAEHALSEVITSAAPYRGDLMVLGIHAVPSRRPVSSRTTRRGNCWISDGSAALVVA
jgi:hypothetical protein